MGRKERRKGTRVEYQVRNFFRQAGFECVRVPCSGNAEGFRGDLRLRVGKTELSVEVKVRKRLFLYKWLSEADFLVVKADRKEPLLVMELGKFLELLKNFRR